MLRAYASGRACRRQRGAMAIWSAEYECVLNALGAPGIILGASRSSDTVDLRPEINLANQLVDCPDGCRIGSTDLGPMEHPAAPHDFPPPQDRRRCRARGRRLVQVCADA